MKKNISIVTSGHPYYDERIFYKFARSLNKNEYDVSIICSTVESELDIVKDNIHIIGFNGSNLKKSEKVRKFLAPLTIIKPDIIICCEPLPILAANKFRKKSKNVRIIYDVTEWYPENVAFKFSGLKKFTSYFSLFLYNVYASNLADIIIVGESRKKRRYDIFAPLKQKKIISYYPVVEFFKYSPAVFNDKDLILCYAGLLKFDRGIKQILLTANTLARLHKNLRVKLKLVGKFETKAEEKEFNELVNKTPNVEVILTGWTEYPNISDHLSDVHICFDLREKNFVYRNSLPIKIFEYMACGKPFIFSDIQPIRDEIEFEKCGSLVDPNNLASIVSTVEEYITDHVLLIIHAKNGRSLIETRYNWETESQKLLTMIRSLIESK